MIRGPQDLPAVRELLALTDLALAHGNLPAGDRKALVKQRAVVAGLLHRAEIEERLSLAVARGRHRADLADVGTVAEVLDFYGQSDPREVCTVHLQPEPCQQCAAYVAADL